MLWNKKHIIVAVDLNNLGFVNQEKRSSKKDFQKDIQILIDKAKRIIDIKNSGEFM